MRNFVIILGLLATLCSSIIADEHKLTVYATLPDGGTLPLAVARWLRTVDAATDTLQLHLSYDNADSADLAVMITPENDALTMTLIPQTQLASSDVLITAIPLTLSLQVPPPAQSVDAATAVTHYAAGNLAEAAQLFEQLYRTADAPLTGQIATYRATAALIEGDYDTAEKWLQKAPASSSAAVVNRAWLYVQTGREATAVTVLSTALATADTPDEQLLLRRKRAEVHALVYDYASAVADMDAAIALADSHDMPLAPLYTQRGEMILLLYEWDRALENFDQALAIDDTYAPAYFQRGVLYYTMAQRENALADFEQYLSLLPDDDNPQAEAARRYIDSIETELEALGS